MPDDTDDQRTAAAVKVAEDRVRTQAHLESIGDSLTAIIATQTAQATATATINVELGKIGVKLDADKERLDKHSARMDKIEDGPGKSGMVSGGLTGAGSAGAIWLLLEKLIGGG